MYTEVILTGAIGLIATVLSAWASWFFTRKKYDSEVLNSILEGVKKALEIYLETIEDSKKLLHDALEENQRLRSELTNTLALNRELEEKVDKLKDRISELLETIYTDLVRQMRKDPDDMIMVPLIEEISLTDKKSN